MERSRTLRNRESNPTVRQRPVEDKENSSSVERERQIKTSVDLIWDQTNGFIKSKVHLLRAMRKADVVLMPTEVSEDAAIAALLYGKTGQSPRHLIERHGVAYFTWMVDQWKLRIMAAFEAIRKDGNK